MRKKTVGSIASELQTKNTHSFDARELQRATEQEYLAPFQAQRRKGE